MPTNIRRRDYFSENVEEKNRIGNDMLLMDKVNYWVEDSEPFIAEATTAIFITRGWANMSINMVDYTIKAPSMVIFLEGMIVKHGELSDNANIDVIVLSKRFADNILSDSNMFGLLRSNIMKDPVFPIYGRERVTFAFNYLLWNIVNMKDSPYRLEAARHMTFTLFYGFALSHPSRAMAQQKSVKRGDDISEQFFALVRDNYHEHRTVTYYASKLCITPKYLSQVVKDATGRPALDCIDDFVIAESKALLRSTDMTIEQISDSLGFANQSLFGKYFKRITGQSPRAYRSQAKQSW